MKKARIDAVLAERGLFPSRTAAAGAVRAGAVRVGSDGPVALRPSQLVEPEAALIVAEGPRFVSRGGIKLDNALEPLALTLTGARLPRRRRLDRWLQRLPAAAGRRSGDRRSTSPTDRSTSSLRNDPRVTVIERLNARELCPRDLPFVPDLATIDVSFISLAKILPAVAACLEPGGEVLAMVKPQFELGRERVGRGVVRDLADRREAILGVALAARELGLPIRGFASSGLPGPKGNRETFVWCGGGGEEVGDLEAAIAEAEPARQARAESPP